MKMPKQPNVEAAQALASTIHHAGRYRIMDGKPVLDGALPPVKTTAKSSMKKETK